MKFQKPVKELNEYLFLKLMIGKKSRNNFEKLKINFKKKII